jgi:hypothetical protein
MLSHRHRLHNVKDGNTRLEQTKAIYESNFENQNSNVKSHVCTHILGVQAGLSGGCPMCRWSTVEGAENATVG